MLFVANFYFVSRYRMDATTFSIATLSITTFSIKGLFVTLSINNILHK